VSRWEAAAGVRLLPPMPRWEAALCDADALALARDCHWARLSRLALMPLQYTAKLLFHKIKKFNLF
jgi:hypothetical protein